MTSSSSPRGPFLSRAGSGASAAVLVRNAEPVDTMEEEEEGRKKEEEEEDGLYSVPVGEDTEVVVRNDPSWYPP